MALNAGFEKFALDLANGGKLTGIYYIPDEQENEKRREPTDRPLLVLIHGGGCTCHYFDVDREYSFRYAAQAFGVPAVSIDRPCYGGTSTLLPLPPIMSFHRQTGQWEHTLIFPALWENFGIPHGCTSMVLVGHSLATPGMIVSSALHSQDPDPRYPLSGLVISGWGTKANQTSQEERLTWSRDEMLMNRAKLMLSDPSLDAADHRRLKRHLKGQTNEPPPDEAREVVKGEWDSYWRKFAKEVRVPIMYGIGEHDWLWEASQTNVAEFAEAFPNAPRVESGIVLGAPHAIDWGYAGGGWRARCVGFALECAAWYRRRKESARPSPTDSRRSLSF